jgi:hypothetical protein
MNQAALWPIIRSSADIALVFVIQAMSYVLEFRAALRRKARALHGADVD